MNNVTIIRMKTMFPFFSASVEAFGEEIEKINEMRNALRFISRNRQILNESSGKVVERRSYA